MRTIFSNYLDAGDGLKLLVVACQMPQETEEIKLYTSNKINSIKKVTCILCHYLFSLGTVQQTIIFGKFFDFQKSKVKFPSQCDFNQGWSTRDNQLWTALFHSFDVFSADSENMKNISADQPCFRADQL